MKKQFIAIATTLTLLTSSIYAASIYTDIDESTTCYQAVLKLNDFGIMGGYEDNIFRPDNTLTRAEAARLVISALNYDESATDDLPSYYPDVPQDYWANKYLTLASANNIINGDEDGNFRPEDTITYNEYIKMMMCTLGYEPVCERNGGYPKGYLTSASSLEVTKGTSFFVGSDEISRSDAAIILSNALETPLYLIIGYKEDSFSGKIVPQFDIADGNGNEYRTLLTNNHNIYKVDGTVSSEPLENSKNDTYNGKSAVDYSIISKIEKNMTVEEVNELIPENNCISDTENQISKTVQYYAGKDRFLNLVYFKSDNQFILEYMFKSDPDGNLVHEYDLK